MAGPAHLVQKLPDRPGDGRAGRDRTAFRAQPRQAVRRQLSGREALGEPALRLAHLGMGLYIHTGRRRSAWWPLCKKVIITFRVIHGSAIDCSLTVI